MNSLAGLGNVAGIAGAGADAAPDAGAIGVLDESVVARLGNGLGDGAAGVELPAEQLTPVAIVVSP
jgi:hypothetical protein